ncbi:MAG: HD domain-containing protein [Salinibacterium sp.]|nr:HD domain-containing protein [Salinibacterium sp.]
MTSSALTTAALDLATAHEIPSVLNHSVRTHGYALLHAQKLELVASVDYDPELLFVACVLHDLGASEAFDGPQRFEVEAADAAASLLEYHGRTPADTDQVWQAIALHTSPGIVERRGPVPMLTRLGVRTDFFSVSIPDELRIAAEREYPRLGLDHELGALLVEQALRQPEKARESSWVSDLVREHQHAGWQPPAGRL